MKITSKTDFWNTKEWQTKTHKLLTIYAILLITNGGLAIWQNKITSLIISLLGLIVYYLMDRSYQKWKGKQNN